MTYDEVDGNKCGLQKQTTVRTFALVIKGLSCGIEDVGSPGMHMSMFLCLWLAMCWKAFYF